MPVNKPNKIITHHALSTKHHTAADVSRWHRDRWNGYRPSRRGGKTRFAGYHVVIEWDGTIIHCRDFDEEGIHCKGQNFSSIGVCFMGNFDNHFPSKAQIESWKFWYAEEGQNLPVYPHRKYATKSCHGKLLDDSFFADMVNREYMINKIELLKMVINKLRTLITLQRMKG